MTTPLFAFRTALERTMPNDRIKAFAQILVECSVRLDFENLPCLRVVVTENAEYYHDDGTGRGTGEFAAFAGDVLFVSGSQINSLQPGERETLDALVDTELRAWQEQREANLGEAWFAQYAPKYDFDQWPALKRAA